MSSAFHAFVLVDLGWGDDLYYGAIQPFAALTVCDFLSESATLRVLTLTTQGSAFWTVLYLIRFLSWMPKSPERRDSFDALG